MWLKFILWQSVNTGSSYLNAGFAYLEAQVSLLLIIHAVNCFSCVCGVRFIILIFFYIASFCKKWPSFVLRKVQVRIRVWLIYLMIFYFWRQCLKILEEDFTEPNQRNSDLCPMSKGMSVKGNPLDLLFPAILCYAVFTVNVYFIWSVKDKWWAARFWLTHCLFTAFPVLSKNNQYLCLPFCFSWQSYRKVCFKRNLIFLGFSAWVPRVLKLCWVPGIYAHFMRLVFLPVL